MMRACLSNPEDSYTALKLMSYPACNYVEEYFYYCREYESGIRFALTCRTFLDNIPEGNRDKNFYYAYENTYCLQLEMLDCMNRWAEYISVYESYFPEHPDNTYNSFRYEEICKRQELLEHGKNITKYLRHGRTSDFSESRCCYIRKKIKELIGGN